MKQNLIRDFVEKFAGQENILTIPRTMLEFFNGDYAKTLFVSQLAYWIPKSKTGWVYKTFSEWKNEICISEWVFKRIIGELAGREKTDKKTGVIIKSEKKYSEKKYIEIKFSRENGIAVNHYRLTNKFFEDFEKFITSVSTTSQPDRMNPTDRSGENLPSGKDESSYSLKTENTNRDYNRDYKDNTNTDDFKNSSHSKDELNSNSNTQSSRFAPPTPAQVDEYIASSRRPAWRDKWGVPYPGNINGEAFVNYYEARGWFAGKAKMKSWQAALRTWEQSAVERMPELKKRLQENEYDSQISDTMTRSELFELLNICKCSKAGVQRINVLIQKRIDEARGE